MIKAVFFDIDNTVYNYDRANARAMEELMRFGRKEFALEPEKMSFLLSETQKMVQQRLGTASAAIHNRLIRFQCFLERLEYPDLSKALAMERLYWDTLLKASVLEPGLVKLLQALLEAGILTGIGSDQNSGIQYQKLEKLGILPYFRRIVTSEEAGAEKPAAEFFRLCKEKAGCLAQECVFIGDNLRKDVEGACKNGLYGVWYQPGRSEEKGCSIPVIHSYRDCIKADGIHLGEKVIKFKSCKGEEYEQN